ncbi:MAG: rod shape-determining protein MreC, partial [Acidobacteriales bacterium]|nr:rod shape-determining protein MreC [Terriglobales bacterium]
RTQQLERLFGFKEQYVTKTLAAQVIYSSGTDASHILYIDKGKHDGLVPELPVITPDGIVGKVREVYENSAQVLLLNDQQSGVGVMLEKTRRQGIMKGSVSGQLEIHYIMSDEKVDPGEKVYTSGGDRIFPKGLEVGEVTKVLPDKERDGFQLIRVKPNANLFRLEEVLVVMHVDDKMPAEEQQLSPAEMLASRLPTIDKQQAQQEAKLDENGKAAAPPPVKPAKALVADRFSPPEERSAVAGGAAKPKSTPKVERVAEPTVEKPKTAETTEPQQDPQEH